MNKIFNYILSLSLSQKLFLIVYCYGFGYVVGDTIKNVLGTL
ncbi:hypothetical protein I230019B6_13620 [Firmicutes bacterium i23-0019-B6]